MPIIEFLGDGHDGERLLSYMYFPDDIACRQRLFPNAEEAKGKAPPSSGTRKPSLSNWPLKVSDAGYRGTVAGEILLRIAVMDKHGIRDPSVNKAVYSIRRQLETLTGVTTKTKNQPDIPEYWHIPLDERSYRSYLTAYRPVAHLWAAHQVLARRVPFFEMHEVLRDQTELRAFLSHAAWFLRFGTDHTTRNAKARALLDPAQALMPNAPIDSIEPSRDEFLEDLRTALEGYKAPKKRLA
ncbi:MAG: hypothetical protein WKH97_20705 [Casimicrobiaceae bacterium]